MGPTGPFHSTEPTDSIYIIVYVCLFTLYIVRGPTGLIRTTEPLLLYTFVCLHCRL